MIKKINHEYIYFNIKLPKAKLLLLSLARLADNTGLSPEFDIHHFWFQNVHIWYWVPVLADMEKICQCNMHTVT